jgi:hypothetical protein
MLGKKYPANPSLSNHLPNNKILNFSIGKLGLYSSMFEFGLCKVKYFFFIILLYKFIFQYASIRNFLVYLLAIVIFL